MFGRFRRFGCVFGWLAIGAVLTGALVMSSGGEDDAVGLVISEACPQNFNLVSDSNGEYSDYIELCNEGDVAVNLSDYWLSDDGDNPSKFGLPDIELAAGERILIWADGSTGECEGEVHANFRLSDGETVILTTANGEVVDAVELDGLVENVSATRLGGKIVKAYGTPNVENDDCELYEAAKLDMPKFSLESGFYPSESITLEIKVPKGVTVYYTTDGSIPDVNSAVYVEALVLTDASENANRYVNVKNTVPNYDTHDVNNDPVKKANVIRAIAVDKRGNFSKVKTATFFVGEVAKEYEGWAVMSIVSEPEGLFGDNGICVTGAAYDEWYNNTDRSAEAPIENFQQHGRQWERRATIQLWDAERNLVLEQDCGMRVQGNTWRKQAIKRFSFYAREHYSGSDVFDAPIFPSGVLSHSFYTRSDVADVVVENLVANRELATQEGIPTVCFLDGELYSVTFIRERHDSTYFSEHYGIDEDDVVVITCGEVDEGTEEDLEEYREFIDFATNADMTDPLVYAELEKSLDVQSFIDFMVANMYCNNLDIATNQNFKMWKSRTSGGDGYYDGKWRMASYDMDAVAWAFFVRTDSSLVECNPFKYTLGVNEKFGGDSRSLINVAFFQNLLRNQSFKERFITTYLDMMNTNFSMRSYGGEAFERQGDTQGWPWPVKVFTGKDVCALLTERHDYAVEHLKFAFDLTGVACPVTVEVGAGGKVRVNTTEAYARNDVWSATYISGMEMVLTAEAEDGWLFVGWQGDLSSTEESVSVLLSEEGLSLKAVFVKKGDGNYGN